MLKKSKCCLPTLSGKALTMGALTCSAMLLFASSASAQSQCGASITPTVDAPPGTVFAVGQQVEIDVVFGPTSTPASNTGYQRISQVTVQMIATAPRTARAPMPARTWATFWDQPAQARAPVQPCPRLTPADRLPMTSSSTSRLPSTC
jgi:hypothetical protein